MIQRIHILGASGSGTTTLARALAGEMQLPHLDTDSYYWTPTDPPFIHKNEPADRVRMIEQDIAGVKRWIWAGSICGWGDPLMGHFTLAVFLYIPPSMRMARLASRERERPGPRIDTRANG